MTGSAVMMTVALACPVCVGVSDAPMAYASNAGIATLMAVTLIVLAGIGGLVLRIARRARIAAASAAIQAPPRPREAEA